MGFGLLDRDLVRGNFLERLEDLEVRVKDLERLAASSASADERFLQPVSSGSDDFSSTPTSGEIDGVLGGARFLVEGALAVLNVGGKESIWLVAVVDGEWAGVQLALL